MLITLGCAELYFCISPIKIAVLHNFCHQLKIDVLRFTVGINNIYRAPVAVLQGVGITNAQKFAFNNICIHTQNKFLAHGKVFRKRFCSFFGKFKLTLSGGYTRTDQRNFWQSFFHGGLSFSGRKFDNGFINGVILRVQSIQSAAQRICHGFKGHALLFKRALRCKGRGVFLLHSHKARVLIGYNNIHVRRTSRKR